MKKHNNKIPKGVVSLVTIIALLSSILASSIYYGNSITANVVKESSINDEGLNVYIKHINDIGDLGQLNEGWYQIKNGYVYYLESFNYYVPLWIKVENPEQQNGLLVVESDGTIGFDRTFTGLPESEVADEEEEIIENQITGEVTGLEKVSGFATVFSNYNVVYDQNNKKYSVKKPYYLFGAVYLEATDGTVIKNPNPNDYNSQKLPKAGDNILQVGQKISIKEGNNDIVYELKRNQDNGDLFFQVNNPVNPQNGAVKKFSNREASTDISELHASLYTVQPKSESILISKSDPSKSDYELIRTDGLWYDKSKNGLIIGNDKDIYEYIRSTYAWDINPDTGIIIAKKQGQPDKILTFDEFQNLASAGQIPEIPPVPRVPATTSESAYQIIQDWDGSSMNVKYIYAKAPQATAREVVEKFFGGKIDNEGIVEAISNHYEFKIGGQEAILKKDSTGQYQFFNKNDGSRIYMRSDTEIKIEGKTTQSDSDKLDKVKLEPDIIVGIQEEKVLPPPPQIDEVLTSQFRDTINKYIASEGGKPADWALDRNGNFVCIKDKCSLGSTTILLGSTIPPTGDDGVGREGNIRAIEELKIKLAEEESRQRVRNFFAEVERVFTEFRGLGYYATLFFDESSLLKWRDSVERTFATLYLGTEYWSSALCSQYIDGEDEGIAYAETPQGLVQAAAHIEATRTEPITTQNGTEFIYKITFNVRNGDYSKDPSAPKEMNINVILKGQRSVKVFKQDIKIDRGDTFGRTGTDAIVQDSPTMYREVCIEFDEVPLKWSIDNDELCNKIIEESGAATPLSKKGSSSSSGGAGGGDDVNDF